MIWNYMTNFRNEEVTQLYFEEKSAQRQAPQ